VKSKDWYRDDDVTFGGGCVNGLGEIDEAAV
jgi:hypothetical protein